MVQSLFTSMDISASGLYSQRTKINTISENIANAETTKTEDGMPYRRKITQLKAGIENRFEQLFVQNRLKMEKTGAKHFPDKPFRPIPDKIPIGVSVAKIMEDDSPFKMIFDPAHPDANEEGYVSMPNVDIVREMTELIASTRAFEANVTAINSSKEMIKKSLKI